MARFASPQPYRDRFGRTVDIAEDERSWLSAVIGGTLAPGEKLPDLEHHLGHAAAEALRSHEEKIAADTLENGAIWKVGEAEPIETRRSTSRRVVRMTTALLRGNVFTHNHPAGTPPSIDDIEGSLREGLAELRVATSAELFRVQPGIKPLGLPVKRLPGYHWIVSAASVVSSQMRPSASDERFGNDVDVRVGELAGFLCQKWAAWSKEQQLHELSPATPLP